MGVEAMVDALDTKFSSLYKEQTFSTFRVRGQSAGLYKNAGTLSYVRVFGAGHEVPAYKVCYRHSRFFCHELIGDVSLVGYACCWRGCGTDV